MRSFSEKFDQHYTPKNSAIGIAATTLGIAALAGIGATFCECVYLDTVSLEYFKHGAQYAATVMETMFPATMTYSLLAGGVIAFKAAQEECLHEAKKLVATVMLATGAFVCTQTFRPACEKANLVFNEQFQSAHDQVQLEKLIKIRQQQLD